MKTANYEVEQIIHWLEHCEAIESSRPEIFRKWESAWRKINPESSSSDRLRNEKFCAAAVRLHKAHPEFVLHARIDWAIMSLFGGRTWSRTPKIRGKGVCAGGLPPLFDAIREYPAGFPAAARDTLTSWADIDHTHDGKGLGIVGPYGSEKARAAVVAILDMFKKFPFRYPQEAESLSEPRGRTASFFRANEISDAHEDLSKEEDSFEYAVAHGIIEDCKNHEMLVITGIGEIPMNSAASSAFLNILEHRRMHRRPTVWTTQFNSGELEKRFAPRMGSLIVQKLSKGSTILKV